MKYQILWHDCEDDRNGSSFLIEAENPKDAYFKGIDTIKSYSLYLKEHFCSIDLECLIDENGGHLWPEDFL